MLSDMSKGHGKAECFILLTLPVCAPDGLTGQDLTRAWLHDRYHWRRGPTSPRPFDIEAFWQKENEVSLFHLLVPCIWAFTTRFALMKVPLLGSYRLLCLPYAMDVEAHPA
jgi:hypothetical protein